MQTSVCKQKLVSEKVFENRIKLIAIKQLELFASADLDGWTLSSFSKELGDLLRIPNWPPIEKALPLT